VGEIERERIETVMRGFLGPIRQVPPMVSAVKHEGKRLYELAREGIEVEREAREVEIHALTLLRAEGSKFWIDVECSKGTYIRTLAKDIGQVLGTGAHLSYLIRTGTGRFTIAESVTLAEIRDAVETNRIQDMILPIDWGIRSLPKVLVDSRALKKAMNGARLQKGDYAEYPQGLGQGDQVRMYVPDGFLAIAEVVDSEEEILQPVKVFA
jgi:tRNA pseudouridine55 synthase